MPKFWYSAYNNAGGIERGEIDARSRADALSALSARGLLAYESSEVTSASTARRGPVRWPVFNRMGLKHYAEFSRTLSVLLGADIPLDASLRLLVHQTASGRTKLFAEKLLTDVTAGRSLSAAVAEADPEAPGLLISLLRAGEARGHLAPALSDLAYFFEARIETRNKIQSALTYPAILCVMALGAIAMIITVLIPALMPLFEDSGARPPLILRLANDMSTLVTLHGLHLAVAVISVLLMLALLLRQPEMRRRIDQAALIVPGLGAVVRQMSTALFARTLGTLLNHGVSLLPALEIAAGVIPNQTIKSAIAQSAEHIKEGHRLSEALTQTRRLPELALRFIAIGEEASKVDLMLLHLADLTEKEVQNNIDRAMTLLSPVLTIVIGGLIGGLFISVIQALLSVNQMVLS